MLGRKLVYVMFLGVVPWVGCDKKPDAPAAGATSATAAVSSLAPTVASAAVSASASHGPGHMAGKHRRAHMMGPASMFFRAAGHLADLDAGQKTKLEELEGGFKKGPPPAETAVYHTELSAQIKAGKIDKAKLEPLQAAAEKVMIARHDKEVEALNALHALLKPGQRTALVAAIKAKKHGHHEGGAMHGKSKDRLTHLTKDLKLDDAQQKQVEAILPKDDPKADGEEWKKRSEAMLTAFEKDDFDAKKQDMFTKMGESMKGKGPMDPGFLDKLLPILKPEQRDALAVKLGPGMHKGMHKGGEMTAPSASAPPSAAPSAPPSAAPSAGAADDDDD